MSAPTIPTLSNAIFPARKPEYWLSTGVELKRQLGDFLMNRITWANNVYSSKGVAVGKFTFTPPSRPGTSPSLLRGDVELLPKCTQALCQEQLGVQPTGKTIVHSSFLPVRRSIKIPLTVFANK